MSRTREYRHTEAQNQDISTTGTLADSLVADRAHVSVAIDGSVASDYALDVDFGDGSWQEWTTFGSTDTVRQTLTLAVERARVRNTTGQTSGDTADVRLGAV